MVTSIARVPEPRIPLGEISTGPDAQAILAQRGADLEELVQTSFSEDSAKWRALVARMNMAAAIEHPVIRRMIAIEASTQTIVLPGDRDPLLADMVVQTGCDITRIAKIIQALAAGIAAIHHAGMSHGQINPWSIRVGFDDKPHIEMTGLRSRSMAHPWIARCSAPEIDRGARPSASADIFALGSVLELFAGTRTPPPALRALIDQMTGDDPECRPNAIEVMHRLDTGKGRALPDTVRDLDREILREPRPTPGLRIGRFELARQLGVGSTGEVWSAHDRAEGPDVAIKLLRPDIAKDPELLRRFRKEARVLAMVGSPYVANVIDLNEDRGLHYIVLELVPGGTVAGALERRGTLPEPLALAIIADACRALEEPHRQGIVHRDVKPDNLMFVTSELPTNLTEQIVKLGDFGISRLVEPARVEGTSATQEGVMLGTPEYMAPEQCQGKQVTPATDVYALACSLFAMIAGRAPFPAMADGHVAVILRLVSEIPPTLASLVPDVTPAVSELVARCLAKDPSSRPQDAAELLAEIDQLRFGSKALVKAHPAPPVRFAKNVQVHSFEWELAASPEQLWPHVSNTEKMNRAAGLAAVKFEIDAEHTVGLQKVAGVSLKWKEHPYEWIEGKRHTVLRVFDDGPLRWYTAEVSLERLPNGGTKLRNVITMEPRRLIFRIVAWFQIGVMYKRQLDKIYRRLDKVVASGPAPGVDPIAPEVVLKSDSRVRLEQGRIELAAAVEERAADAVVNYLQKASDQDVARIRPLELAAKYDLPETELVDASLHAARLGLVEMVWDVICPSCRIPSTVVDSLAKIEEHANCKACNLDYKVDFSRAIELAFRASAAVREVETETFCIGGPGNFPHVVAQIRLQPQERYSLSLALPPGYYVVRSPQLPGETELRVVAGGGVRRVDLTLGDRVQLPALIAGDQLIAFTSNEPREIVVRVERAGERAFALTAARVMASATFRDLFPDQQLAPGRLMAITQTTLVVAQLADSAALFKELGDSKAFPVAAKFFATAAQLAVEHGGSVVKTFGGMVICAFDRPTAAIDAALALQSKSGDRPCGVAVHRGPMMALTQAGRLDYFGQNVERAIEILPTVPAGAVGLTETACRDVGVAERLATRSERISLEVLPDGGWVQYVRSKA